ncbi:MAG TPA: hypothetical protein VK448_09825 [Dissulfurispiraceae bacterium]|nr:hypothetical protein [Dissulfurispiraceae bacterium]
MFEHKSEPLLSGRAFAARLAGSAAIGASLVLISLAIGMAGYHAFEGLSWIDAFLNAAMLLGGMGPVNSPGTYGGKLFAGLYALYCGLIVIIVAGVLLAPIVHRALHRFHLVQGKL